MKAAINTLLEVLILVLIAIGIASAANGLRTKGSIKLTRNYFDRSHRGVNVALQGNTMHRGKTPAQPSTSQPASAPATAETKVPKPAGTSSDRPAKEDPDYGYQTVSFEQVEEIFQDPQTEMGVNLFIDARDDDHFTEGHIPGAVQVDHYRLEDYIDNALRYTDAAEKVIVYCNGGDCEDSLFVCGDLLEFDVPWDKIYLFAGGWKEWTAHDMPIATGTEDDGQ